MKELEVKLYGRLLGTITRDDRTHETRLTYAKEYLEDPRTVALSAGLPKQEQPIAWERAGRWFDGLLPEGERRARVSREVGRRGCRRTPCWKPSARNVRGRLR